MAKFPDGHVFIYKPKRTKIEIEEHELVMCRNCKHRVPEDHKCDHHWHAYSPLAVDDEFWCGYGEKWECLI